MILTVTIHIIVHSDSNIVERIIIVISKSKVCYLELGPFFAHCAGFQGFYARGT